MIAAKREPADETVRVAPIGLKHNVFWTMLGSVVFGATNLGIQMALAKLGTPTMLGEYVLAVSIVQPISSLAQLNLRGVQSTDARREYRFPHYFWLRTILSLLVLVIVAGMAAAGRYSAEARAVIVLACVGTVFDSIGDIVYGAYQQGERMDRMGISMTVKGILSLGFLAGFLYFTHSVIWAVIGNSLASVLVVSLYDIPCGWWYARSIGNTTKSITPVSLVRLAWLALPLGITVFFSSLFINFPRYFLVHSHSVADLAYLAAPSVAMQLGIYMVSIIGQPMSPRLARYAVEGDRRSFVKLFGKLAGIIWAIGALVIGVSIVGGRELITVMFAKVYANHFDVFLWMMVAAVTSYAGLVCGIGITAVRWFKVQILWTGSVALVSLISSVLLVPKYGILGVAMAICATMVARLVIGYAILGLALMRLRASTESPMLAMDREGIRSRIRKALKSGLKHPALRVFDPEARMISVHDPKKPASITYTHLIDPQPVTRRYPDFTVGGEEQIFPHIEKHGLSISSYRAGVVSMRGGRVCMPQGVSGVDGRFVRENYIVGISRPKDVLAAHRIWGNARRHAGEAVLLSLTGTGNFYHWTAEILPRLMMVQSDPRWSELPIVIPASAPGFVKRSLKLVVDPSRIVELSDGTHRFDVLHVPTTLGWGEQISPVAAEWLRDNFVKDQAAPPTRRLYVSRRDAPTRSVANEDEVERMLSTYGFETISLSGLPFEEQIELFSSASIVVGSHGAGFTNMVFCRPGTTLVELFSPQFISLCYWSLSNVCGHRYGFIMNEDSGHGLRVDVDALETVLREKLGLVQRDGADVRG